MGFDKPSEVCAKKAPRVHFHGEAQVLNWGFTGLHIMALLRPLSIAYGILPDTFITGTLLLATAAVWYVLGYTRTQQAAFGFKYRITYEVVGAYTLVFLRLSFIYNPVLFHSVAELAVIPVTTLAMAIVDRRLPPWSCILSGAAILCGASMTTLACPPTLILGAAFASCQVALTVAQQLTLHLARRDLASRGIRSKVNPMVLQVVYAPFQGTALLGTALLAGGLSEIYGPKDGAPVLFPDPLWGVRIHSSREWRAIIGDALWEKFRSVFWTAEKVEPSFFLPLLLSVLLLLAFTAWAHRGGELKLSLSTRRGCIIKLFGCRPDAKFSLQHNGDSMILWNGIILCRLTFIIVFARLGFLPFIDLHSGPSSMVALAGVTSTCLGAFAYAAGVTERQDADPEDRDIGDEDSDGDSIQAGESSRVIMNPLIAHEAPSVEVVVYTTGPDLYKPLLQADQERVQ